MHNLDENSDTLECDVRKVMKQVVPTYKEPDVVNKKAMENKVNLKLQTVNGKNKDKKSKEKKDNCDLELMRKEG